MFHMQKQICAETPQNLFAAWIPVSRLTSFDIRASGSRYGLDELRVYVGLRFIAPAIKLERHSASPSHAEETCNALKYSHNARKLDRKFMLPR